MMTLITNITDKAIVLPICDNGGDDADEVGADNINSITTTIIAININITLIINIIAMVRLMMISTRLMTLINDIIIIITHIIVIIVGAAINAIIVITMRACHTIWDCNASDAV